MVERICGVPRDLFLKVCRAWTENSGRERTAALVYSVGWTQHSVGPQYIPAGAIIQLLLGNIGRPGGGVYALRGHASIQGSTDTFWKDAPEIETGEIVGSPAEQPALLAALKRATHGGLAFHPCAADAAAEEAIGDQAIHAALVLDQGIPRVLVSSASGYSVARVLEMAAEQIELETGLRLYIVVLHPLPPTDRQGLVSFYVTLASSILGFVTMFQLRANAPGLKFRDWLAAIAVLAIVGGLVLAVVVDPLIGALHGPFPELWLALAAEVAVAALFCSTMLVLVGRWAIIPTWTLFVTLGTHPRAARWRNRCCRRSTPSSAASCPPARRQRRPHRRVLPP